jgi:uncharacterized FlgJ-related protein|tara:strand:+ start:1686 stop:2195 length:510 start_codon:yes stop_codon:yes gene_type:complete
MTHICATILILCTLLPTYFNDERDIFVQEISECAIVNNVDYTGPSQRIPIKIVMAIAALESGWGTSRFAREGNNYFGMQTKSDDIDEYIIPKNNKKLKIKRYKNVCESVNDFMDLISQSKLYREFQKELMEQWISNEISYIDLIYSMPRYSRDPKWETKVLSIIKKMVK